MGLPALKHPELSLREIREQEYRDLFQLIRDQNPKGFYTAAKRLCLHDLYFLTTEIMGRKDMKNDWIFDRCVEVQNDPDGFLDLWAREHYKSTIITFAKTIQDLLINPEITIGIFSHTRPIAKAFLAQIKRELETNLLLKQIFPDVLWQDPKKEAPVWSLDSGIIVRRGTNPKEATIEAWGLVDGQPTSKHFDILVYDDVVTRESVYTPEMIKKTTEAWELSLNLGAREGRRRTIGTRYHFNDTYSVMMTRGSVKKRLYPATENGETTGKPVLLSAEKLAEKRRDMGIYTFSCQMLQNPKADEAQGFMNAWLQFWTPAHMWGMNRYVICDPASSKKKDSDYTVFFVIGASEDENFYVIDMIRDRLNLTERANTLFNLHKTYKPLGVGYEQYGMQADIEHFKDRQRRENYRFGIVPLGGMVPKEERIRGLIPLFQSGRVYIPEMLTKRNYEGSDINLTHSFITEEYEPFPVGHHDDMLDCLARITDPALGIKFPGARSKAQAVEAVDSTGWT